MNKKLVIIIIIQAFIVTFLLGILLGMNIQKKRYKNTDESSKQSESSVENENNKDKSDSLDNTDTDEKNSSDSSDDSDKDSSKDSDNADKKDSSSDSDVYVERDVDYGSMDVPEPTTDDWLYTDGSKILDKDGNEVWLTGINWFGYNTGTNTFDGLWASDLNQSIQEIQRTPLLTT